MSPIFPPNPTSTASTRPAPLLPPSGLYDGPNPFYVLPRGALQPPSEIDRASALLSITLPAFWAMIDRAWSDVPHARSLHFAILSFDSSIELENAAESLTHALPKFCDALAEQLYAYPFEQVGRFEEHVGRLAAALEGAEYGFLSYMVNGYKCACNDANPAAAWAVAMGSTIYRLVVENPGRFAPLKNAHLDGSGVLAVAGRIYMGEYAPGMSSSSYGSNGYYSHFDSSTNSSFSSSCGNVNNNNDDDDGNNYRGSPNNDGLEPLFIPYAMQAICNTSQAATTDYTASLDNLELPFNSVSEAEAPLASRNTAAHRERDRPRMPIAPLQDSFNLPDNAGDHVMDIDTNDYTHWFLGSPFVMGNSVGAMSGLP